VEKLKIMEQYPPQDPNAHKNHKSFAWITSLLTEQNGAIVGFLMPAIEDSVELIDVYSPIRRRKLGLHVNWRFLHVTAFNIASIVATIHEKGYILGDIKPQNILVNRQALPSIIDTDSFQVQDPVSGEIHPCLVGTPEFAPPELIGRDLATTTQTETHDRFRLAIIIYYLLFGSHPFQGKWKGGGESPDTTELIRRGIWLYSADQLLQPVARNIPMEIVHPEVQRCFHQCFSEGYSNPNLRPSARDWFQALKIAFEDLRACQHADNHHYSHLAGQCYWCERAVNLGVDIFAKSSLLSDRGTYSESRQTASSPQGSTTINYALANSLRSQAQISSTQKSNILYILGFLFFVSTISSIVGSILALRQPLDQMAPVVESQPVDGGGSIVQLDSQNNTSLLKEQSATSKEDWRKSTGLYKPLYPNEYKEVGDSVQWIN
jgi:serine/threonine protein kinase